ncbi:unnamed protein product [Lampetra planeri]
MAKLCGFPAAPAPNQPPADSSASPVVHRPVTLSAALCSPMAVQLQYLSVRLQLASGRCLSTARPHCQPARVGGSVRAVASRRRVPLGGGSNSHLWMGRRARRTLVSPQLVTLLGGGAVPGFSCQWRSRSGRGGDVGRTPSGRCVGSATQNPADGNEATLRRRRCRSETGTRARRKREVALLARDALG